MSANKYIESNRRSGCLATESKLFDYVDSCLSAPEMQAVRAHLAECEKCRLELEQIKRAESALVASPLSIQAPGDLYAGFADKLAARQSKAPLAPLFRTRYIAPALALAALALFVFRPSNLNHTHGTIRLPASVAVHESTPSKAPGTSLYDKGKFAANTNRPSKLQPNMAQLGFSLTNTITGTDKYSVSSNRVALGRTGRGSDRNRKLSKEKLADIQPALLHTRHDNRLVALAESKGMRYEATAPSTKPTSLRLDGAGILADETQIASDYESRQTNLYASTLGRRDDVAAALSLRAYQYWDSRAEQAAAPGFALVVQDDVRGFTAEAHNSSAVVLPALRAGSAADDGVKVEVEFDGGAGTSSF